MDPQNHLRSLAREEISEGKVETSLSDRLTATALEHFSANQCVASLGQKQSVLALAENISELLEEAREKPTVLVLEGLSGSGKSQVEAAFKNIDALEGQVKFLADFENLSDFISTKIKPTDIIVASQLLGFSELRGIDTNSEIEFRKIKHIGFSSLELKELFLSDNSPIAEASFQELLTDSFTMDDFCKACCGSIRVADRLIYALKEEKAFHSGFNREYEPKKAIAKQLVQIVSAQVAALSCFGKDEIIDYLEQLMDTESLAVIKSIFTEESESVFRSRPTLASIDEHLGVLEFKGVGAYSTVNRYKELIAREALGAFIETRIVITAFGINRSEEEFIDEWCQLFNLTSKYEFDPSAGRVPIRKGGFWFPSDSFDIPDEHFGNQQVPDEISISMGSRNLLRQRSACKNYESLMQMEVGDHQLDSDIICFAGSVEAMLQAQDITYIVSFQSHNNEIVPLEYWLYQPQKRQFITIPVPDGSELFDSEGNLLSNLNN